MSRWLLGLLLVVSLPSAQAAADHAFSDPGIEERPPPHPRPGPLLLPAPSPGPIFLSQREQESARRTRRSGKALLGTAIATTLIGAAATFLTLYAAAGDDSGQSIFLFIPCSFSLISSIALGIAGSAMLIDPVDRDPAP